MEKNERSYYTHLPKILLAIDCIIFGFDEGELKLLLIKKQVGKGKGEWSLVGSFLDPAENLRDCAKRVLKDYTGLEDIYLDQLKTYGSMDRVPGDRIVSVAFYALMRLSEHDKEIVHDFGAEWVNFKDRPELVFDHEEMVLKAMDKLRQKAKNQSLGFELLPEKFTIPQLQHFFEEVYQEKFDKRNFRKKILSLGVLKKLEEKDKESSKKGAFLYSFDKVKYEKMKEMKAFF